MLTAPKALCSQKMKAPKYSLTEECTMEYHAVSKRNKMLTYSTTWTNLEGIVLMKLARHKRTNIARFHVSCLHEVEESDAQRQEAE